MKPSPFRRPLQVATFMRKEMVDVLRQPRLLLTLVIGPFLIMAAFGFGYRDRPAPMRALFVAPADSPFLDQVKSYADQLGPDVKFAGVTSDSSAAQQRLVKGDVDLVVTFPNDPLATVLKGDRAPIEIQHTRLDPIEQSMITFASQLSIDQINGRILAEIVHSGQGLTRPAKELFAATDAALSKVDAALGSGDADAAKAATSELQDLSAQIAADVQASATVAGRIGGTGSTVGAGLTSGVEDFRRAVSDMAGSSTPEVASQNLDHARQALDTITANYDQFMTVNPSVLVQPFRSDVRLAVGGNEHVTDWYAPAAVVLMLQQFGVAFGALSFVRERQLGISDVFRVAPVNAAEALIGKYLAYLLIGTAIGAALLTLVVTTLDVHTSATVGQIAVAVLLSLFASIGVGFLISLASKTDAQAVQYSMLLLLASLFFSGFFLSIGNLEGVARVVGWALPVTYGMRLLRDAMLRGAPLDWEMLAGLSGVGVLVFLLALFGARRRMEGYQ